MRTQIECSVARVLPEWTDKIYKDGSIKPENIWRTQRFRPHNVSDKDESLSNILQSLNTSLTTIASSMVAMERSLKLSRHDENDKETETRVVSEKRKKTDEDEVEEDVNDDSDTDVDRLRQRALNLADSATREKTDAWLEQHDLLK